MAAAEGGRVIRLMVGLSIIKFSLGLLYQFPQFDHLGVPDAQ
jgi:hypothetical protein